MTDLRTNFSVVADFLLADRRGPEGLADGDRLLVTAGCLVTIDPRSDEYRDLIRQALAAGVEAVLLEAILVHAMGYLGVVRVRPAYQVLTEELASVDRLRELGTDLVVDTDREARVETGMRLYDGISRGRPAEYRAKFAPLSTDYYPRSLEMAGLTLATEPLDVRSRELITVAILACLGGQPDQLRFHIDMLLANGVTPRSVAALLMIVQVMAGIPRATVAANAALAAVSESPSHTRTSETKTLS